MTVYIVTSGSHSDYGIRGVYVEREAAEKHVAAHNGSEEYAYDEATIEVWQAGSLKDGLRWSAYQWGNDLTARIEPWATGPINEVTTWVSSHAGTRYDVTVRADDEKSARKIASELIQQYRATTPGAV